MGIIYNEQFLRLFNPPNGYYMMNSFEDSIIHQVTNFSLHVISHWNNPLRGPRRLIGNRGNLSFVIILCHFDTCLPSKHSQDDLS